MSEYKIEPNALKQLVKIKGTNTAAASCIGIHSTTLGQYLKANECPLTAELAARHILSKEDKRTHRVIVAKIDPDKAESVEAFLNAMKIDFKVVA